MGKKAAAEDRSFFRLLFWEALGVAGLLHIQIHPTASELLGLHFFHNALFFVVAYPLLYVYRWKLPEGCLGTILWPVSFVLSWALGVCAYLWTVYLLYFTGNPFSTAMRQHEIALGFLFIFVYFPLIQPLWGISRKYYSLGQLVWVLLFSAFGGFIGFLMGRFVDQQFGIRFGAGSGRFLVWLGLILVGAAVGAFGAKSLVKK